MGEKKPKLKLRLGALEQHQLFGWLENSFSLPNLLRVKKRRVNTRDKITLKENEMHVLEKTIRVDDFDNWSLVDLMTEVGFKSFNSITKYPSIYTYHPLQRGVVQEELNGGLGFTEGDFNITEKVDGTNARIVLYDNEYVIGGREEFSYFMGDVIINPADEVTNAVIDFAESLVDSSSPIYHELDKDSVYVFYLEIFGGEVQRKVAVNYTNDKENVSCRLFDVTCMSHDEFIDVATTSSPDQIAGWRQNNRDRFFSREDLEDLKSSMIVELVPTLSVEGPIPTDRVEVLGWLNQYRNTKLNLDGSGLGRSEGVIVRSNDNQLVRKIRFEDYEDMLKRITEKEKMTDSEISVSDYNQIDKFLNKVTLDELEVTDSGDAHTIHLPNMDFIVCDKGVCNLIKMDSQIKMPRLLTGRVNTLLEQYLESK